MSCRSRKLSAFLAALAFAGVTLAALALARVTLAALALARVTLAALARAAPTRAAAAAAAVTYGARHNSLFQASQTESRNLRILTGHRTTSNGGKTKIQMHNCI